MERRELRHDRYTVSLLTDYMVFSPKYRGKIPVEKTIALVVEGIIRKICEIDENRNHRHGGECGSCPSIQGIPPKYSVSFIAKRIKGRRGRELREAFPHLKEWAGIGLWESSCFHGSCLVVERYVQNQETPNSKSLYAGSVL